MNNHFFDFFLEVSKGLAPDHIAINKYGRNNDINTGSTPELVWAKGGNYEFLEYDPSDSSNGAERLRVTSSSVNDQEGGGGNSGGAHNIIIEGLDQDYNQISETISLLGQNAANSTHEYLRVNRAYVSLAGDLAVNEGRIDIVDAVTGSIVLAYIETGKSQTEQCQYTIPAGYTGYLLDFSGSILKSGSNRNATLELIFREPGSKGPERYIKKSKQQLALESSGSTSFSKFYALPLVIPEKTDVYVQCINVSANSTEIFANLGIVIQKDVV